MQLIVHNSLNDNMGKCCHNVRMTKDASKSEKKALSVEIGKRLSAARVNMDMKLSDVCAALNDGSTVSKMSNYEQGIRELPIALAKKLEPILKVSASYLLTLTDENFNKKEKQGNPKNDPYQITIKDLGPYADNSVVADRIHWINAHFIQLTDEQQRHLIKGIDIQYQQNTRMEKILRQRNLDKMPENLRLRGADEKDTGKSKAG